MKYLLQSTEVYRVETEDEAKNLIEAQKSAYEVLKYSCVYKEQKAKGEVVDSWYKVTIVKNFNNEKEPDTDYKVTYSLNGESEE